MPTRRIALVFCLAAPLWATAQLTHGGPSNNNFGANSQSGSNIFQSPPPAAKPTGPITMDSHGNIISDPNTPGSPTTIMLPTTSANATVAAPVTPVSTGNALAIPSGPDFTTVPLTADPDQIDNKYMLQPGDQFIFQVVEDQEKQKLLLVDEKGQIKVPYLLEPINALDNTLLQVVHKIQDSLTDPKLDLYKTATVRVALFHSDQSRGHVMVTGAVMKPNSLVPVPNDHLLSLADVIRAAGDWAPGADRKDVTIIQQTSDPEKPLKTVVNVEDLISKGQEPNKFILSPGDSVNVPSMSEPNGYVIVSGEIGAQPALRIQLSANEPMTVSQAIIMAKWTDFSKHTVKLQRWERDKDGKETLHQYYVNVDDVIFRAQKDKDMVLMPGDNIYVDYSIFAQR